MGRKPVTELKEKHWQALKLIESGTLTLKQVAKQVGMSTDTLYDLHEGNTEKQGSVADLFQSELRKIEQKHAKEASKLLTSNKLHAQVLIEKILVGYKDKLDSIGSLTIDEKKLVGTLNNSLAKSTPNVEIGSLTYQYTKGLSAQELVHEFTRLRTIAEGASQRGAVSTPLTGGARTIPSTPESGS